MLNIEKPIRMCISCRKRFSKKDLLRLQCIDKKLIKYDGIGRSFYVCNDCCDDTKRVINSIYRQCKNKADYKEQFKEMVRIWKTK